MAIDDWTEQSNANGMVQSTDTAFEQSHSWKFEGQRQTATITYDPSGTAAPTEARIDTRIYFHNGNDDCFIGPIFRWQDVNNYYIPILKLTSDVVELKKVVSGSLSSTIDSVGVSISRQTWKHWDLECYVDSGGSFNVRVRKDTDDDGTLETIGTLQDGANSFSGGAVGLGDINGLSSASSFDPVYIDETKVYY